MNEGNIHEQDSSSFVFPSVTLSPFNVLHGLLVYLYNASLSSLISEHILILRKVGCRGRKAVVRSLDVTGQVRVDEGSPSYREYNGVGMLSRVTQNYPDLAS